MAMRIAEMAALGQNSEICQHTEREDIPCQLLTPAEPAVAETAHNARADARESVLSQSHVVYRVKTRRPVSHTLQATFFKKLSIYQNRSSTSKIAANGHSQDAMREQAHPGPAAVDRLHVPSTQHGCR
jgi:hypothetical protein